METRTTVPSFVTPCDVHWQYPSMGMPVGQVSPPAWHVFADAGPPASAATPRSMHATKPVNLMIRGLSCQEQTWPGRPRDAINGWRRNGTFDTTLHRTRSNAAPVPDFDVLIGDWNLLGH